MRAAYHLHTLAVDHDPLRLAIVTMLFRRGGAASISHGQDAGGNVSVVLDLDRLLAPSYNLLALIHHLQIENAQNCKEVTCRPTAYRAEKTLVWALMVNTKQSSSAHALGCVGYLALVGNCAVDAQMTVSRPWSP